MSDDEAMIERVARVRDGTKGTPMDAESDARRIAMAGRRYSFGGPWGGDGPYYVWDSKRVAICSPDTGDARGPTPWGFEHAKDAADAADALNDAVASIDANIDRHLAIAALDRPAPVDMGEVEGAMAFANKVAGQIEAFAPSLCHTAAARHYLDRALLALWGVRRALAHSAAEDTGVPEGYVLVPKEPTETMIDAGLEAQTVWDNDVDIQWSEAPVLFYRAMLSAAPSAPVAGMGEGL